MPARPPRLGRKLRDGEREGARDEREQAVLAGLGLVSRHGGGLAYRKTHDAAGPGPPAHVFRAPVARSGAEAGRGARGLMKKEEGEGAAQARFVVEDAC